MKNLRFIFNNDSCFMISYLKLKNIFDFIGAALIILLLSPLLIIIYLIIVKDGGYAIYEHTRVGKNGMLFKCLKFRSMVLNSDDVLKRYLAENESAKLEWERDFKLKNDPRVTKIGRFLRKTSLDELPQLFNVLLGQMSLVGPRPIITEELDRYGEKANYYLMVRPGMTGLWQVNGRSDTDYSERVELDVTYVKNISFWGDILILLKTIKVVIKGRGAY